MGFNDDKTYKVNSVGVEDITPQVEAEIPADANKAEVEALRKLTAGDIFAVSQQALTLNSWTGLRIAGIMLVMGCNQAGFGIDWAVISGINSLPAWHNYLHFTNSGSTYGLLNALMNIGTVCGALFYGLADVIGRRGINFAGNFIVIFACMIQAFAVNMPMFMAGRFFMGFGTSLMSSSQYMAEISPIHLRGRLVGIFGACFQIGSLCMNAAMLGLLNLEGNWSWRAPLIIEAIFPIIVCSLIYVITPESPRFLVKQGKVEAAKNVIAKYHTTSGSLEEPLVGLVISQIEDALEGEKKISTPWWDYRVFFTRRVAYRLMVLILYSIFQQWNGGGIITYYLSPALDQIGITTAMPQLGINLGLTATYFVFTACGAYIIDKFKRRTLIFSGLGAIILLQTAATITSWRYSLHPSTATAALTLVWIFCFQIFSSLLIATMHNLYPVEILSLVLRAKGMGLYSLIQGAAGTVQSYGISIGIDKLKYKIWCVYIIYNSVQLVLSYFVFPETYGLSLEEIDIVFETKGVKPVKMSLDMQKAREGQKRAEADAGEEVVIRA